MYFSDNPNDRFYEVLMVSIPNFRLRGYEQMVVDKHIYDCRFCLYYIGHRCKLPRCDCIDERIAAGAASLSEAWQELAYIINYPPLTKRIKHHLYKYGGKPMKFRNEIHERIFQRAADRYDRSEYALLAALYLLSAEKLLWQSMQEQLLNGKLSFNNKSIRDIGEFGYTLYCAAKDIYTGSKHLSVCDLTDKDLIPPQLFELICNAMLIRRYGLGAINRTTER